MKKIFILLLALMPVIAGAQGYKNLPKIEVPDFPANEIRVSQNRINTDSWNVSFALASKGMGVNFDLPFTYDMYFKTDNTEKACFCHFSRICLWCHLLII